MALEDMQRGTSPPPGDYYGEFYASSRLPHQIADKYGQSLAEGDPSTSEQQSIIDGNEGPSNELSDDETRQYRH